MMSPFMLFVLLVCLLFVLFLLGCSFFEKSREKSQQHTSAFQLFLFVLLLTLGLYVIMFMSDNRQQVIKHWHAQMDHAELAHAILTGERDIADPVFFEDDKAYSDAALLNRIEQLMHALQIQTHTNSQEAGYWLHLAGMYHRLNDVQSARKSIAKAHHIAPHDMKIALRFAQVSFAADDGKLNESSQLALNKVLQNNPEHEGALMLFSMAAMTSDDLAQAYDGLKRLERSVANKQVDSKVTNQLSQLLIRLEHQMIQKQKNRASVSALVRLGRQVPKSNTAMLYVNARAQSGVAYASTSFLMSSLSESDDGALQVHLSDEDHLLTSRILSDAKRDRIALFLVAHISETGNAVPQPGDWVSQPVSIDWNNADIPRHIIVNQLK